MSKITVLGLGAMGSRMAANLLAAGHDVTVWNLSSEKAEALVSSGAISAPTPRLAVAQAEFVIAMVADDVASRSIWLDPDTGALAGVNYGAYVIESSTLSCEWVRELGQLSRERGARFLDACVSGSRPQVEAKQLVYFVGGDANDFAATKSVLEAAGGAQIHHVGAIGAGAAVKLATNVLLSVQVVAMAEAMTLLRKEGVDVLHSIDVIGSTFVCSPFAKGVATLMAKQSFAPMFASKLVEKDLAYALTAGNGAALPLIAATHNVFHSVLEHGWAEENLSSVIKLYQ